MMQAKLINLNDVRVGDEIIFCIRPEDRFWHGVVAKIEEPQIMGAMRYRFTTLDLEDGKQQEEAVDSEADIYLVARSPSSEEIDKAAAEACRKMAELAATEPVRYPQFDNDYGATIVRSDDMEGRCWFCGHRACDCETISWLKRMKNWMRNR
jgi:hypothetical protein